MTAGREGGGAQHAPGKYLLDVNVLLAVIWVGHPEHTKAFAWLSNKTVMLCPLSELGFLRISTNRKAIGAPMEKARRLLEQFVADRAAESITDDLAALDSHPKRSEEVTDHYLADLVAKHSARLATFDKAISHAGVELIA